MKARLQMLEAGIDERRGQPKIKFRIPDDQSDEEDDGLPT
jgi:hypothetical protein